MGRVLRNGCAVLRGFLKALCLKLFCGKRAAVGKRLSVFHGASLRIAANSGAALGGNLRIGKDALISVLNGGELTLGDGVSVGENNRIVCHEKISIGKDTILAPNVLIYDHDHVFDAQTGVHKREFKTAPVSIGENCWIGANTVILRGTKIGNNCVVGAGCVLKGDYPDGSVIVQKRKTEIHSLDA